MSLDPDVKITRQVEDNKYDLAGNRNAFVRVEFFVGPHGPFVERFDRDTFTSAIRDEKIMRFAREVRTP